MSETELILKLDDLEAMHDGWDSLAVAVGLPQMAPAWILAWWRHLAPADATPRVVVVRHREEVIGLAPFYVKEGRRGRIDYRLPGIELWARLAPLAIPGREWDVAEAIGSVLTEATPRVDLVALEGAPLASQWPVALRDRWPGPIRPVLRRYSVYGCPTISLREESFDAWFAAKSSSFRAEMRRHRRQFLAAGGAERSSTHETLGSDIEIFVHLHTARWQKRGESDLVAFGDRMPTVLNEIGRAHLDAGRFRLRLLEINDEPIAAHLCVAAGSAAMFVNSGWDERFARFSPVMLCMLGAIEEAFVRGDQRIDLGLGEQAYKQRFADGNDPVAWNILMVPSRRLPLTYARMLPTLSGSYLRQGARRALTEKQLNHLRSLRLRLRR